MSIVELARRRYRRDGVIGILRSAPRYASKPLRLWLRYAQISFADRPTVTQNGVTLSLDNPILKDSSSVLLGNYEMDEIQLLDMYLPQNRDIVELGGGVGFVSCFVNQRIHSSRKQLVIEANPSLLPIIERHRDLNGCGFRVEHAAYAPEEDQVSFYQNDDHHLTSTVHGDKEGAETVEATSLQSLLSTLEGRKLALIADIEGSEVDLVEHELDLLADRFEFLLVEFHDEIRDGSEARLGLQEAGFVQVDRLGDTYVYQKYGSR